MQSLEVFNFKGNKVRSLILKNEPWFILKDLCSVLGLSNPTVVAERLDENERTKYNLGRQGMANIVNESGMYKVVFQIKKKEAKEFTTFVTSEVLPGIRKTGLYGQYPPKSTSAGEVASLIKPVISVMNKQGSKPHRVAKQVETTLNQFGIETIPDFVNEPKRQVKQLSIAFIEEME